MIKKQYKQRCIKPNSKTLMKTEHPKGTYLKFVFISVTHIFLKIKETSCHSYRSN
jgi:hypothetical protein